MSKHKNAPDSALPKKVEHKGAVKIEIVLKDGRNPLRNGKHIERRHSEFQMSKLPKLGSK